MLGFRTHILEIVIDLCPPSIFPALLSSRAIATLSYLFLVTTLWGLRKIPEAVSPPKTSHHGTPWQILVSSLQGASRLSREASAPPKQSRVVTSERILVLPRWQLPLKTQLSSGSEKLTDFMGFSCECGHDGSSVIVLEQKPCLMVYYWDLRVPWVLFVSQLSFDSYLFSHAVL